MQNVLQRQSNWMMKNCIWPFLVLIILCDSYSVTHNTCPCIDAFGQAPVDESHHNWARRRKCAQTHPFFYSPLLIVQLSPGMNLEQITEFILISVAYAFSSLFFKVFARYKPNRFYFSLEFSHSFHFVLSLSVFFNLASELHNFHIELIQWKIIQNDDTLTALLHTSAIYYYYYFVWNSTEFVYDRYISIVNVGMFMRYMV